ncbi:phenylalanine--tRNA ligase subunit beta [Myxococcota bacterium]|nr:phenylalanine--tRNA ligase subunit beta [Myxococcota bacterium]
MRLPIDWLGEFIALPDSETLSDALEMGGFEDVSVVSHGPDLSAVCVGKVLKCGPHPNADRLSVCTVDLGSEEAVEIVCGAPNVAAGQTVAVAPVGTTLPDGTRIKKSKLRGVVSKGMICSRRELQLGDDHEGILILEDSAPVGKALPEVISLGGQVLDLTLTPNRGDAASLLGIAREVRAHFGGDITIPDCDPEESGPASEENIRVSIDAPDDCHEYVGRIVRGVQVGPSPEWLVEKLELSGIRSINNVVDVTNLVLLEFGQPLHAFDLGKISGGEVRIRRAKEGETLTTLDAQERKLEPEDLVIADSNRAIALAGVMGGAETEVREETRDVLLESANFRPAQVRLAARRHGIHSEASYRFERGIDRNGIDRAADRAARLLAEISGGEVATGRLQDRGNEAPVPPEIRFETARVNRLLGTDLPTGEIAALLERVGVTTLEQAPDVLEARIPSHRNDLWLHQDLTEEVARIYGYDRLPTRLPSARLVSPSRPRGWDLMEAARDGLVSAGLQEVVSLPFIAPEQIEALELDSDDLRARPIVLANPIQEEQGALRTTLVPSLLNLARNNLRRQFDAPRFFETCRVFLPTNPGQLPQETRVAVAVLVASEHPGLWEAPAPVFFEAKGVAKKLLNQMGYVASFGLVGIPPYLHPGAAMQLEVEGRRVGVVGELHPKVASRFEIEAPCALLELDLEALVEIPEEEIRAREVSRQPRVRRDIAVVLDANQPAGEVATAIAKAGGEMLRDVEIFDRYEGRGVEDGKVSLAFRLVFQRDDRTLQDAEVKKTIGKLMRMIAHRFGGELRASQTSTKEGGIEG